MLSESEDEIIRVRLSKHRVFEWFSVISQSFLIRLTCYLLPPSSLTYVN